MIAGINHHGFKEFSASMRATHAGTDTDIGASAAKPALTGRRVIVSTRPFAFLFTVSSQGVVIENSGAGRRTALGARRARHPAEQLYARQQPILAQSATSHRVPEENQRLLSKVVRHRLVSCRHAARDSRN